MDRQHQQACVVFRLCVPAAKVGSIIGKEGSNIKSLREDTKARVKVSTSGSKGEDRVVVISTRDKSAVGGEQNPAEKAFMRVYPQVIDSAAEGDESGTLRLLVAGSQAGALIGRGGATIKQIRESSGSQIRVTENVGLTASPNDRLCQISGSIDAIHAAVSSIMAILNANPALESLEELEGNAAPGAAANAAAAAQAAAYAAQTASFMAASSAWPYASPGPMPGLGVSALPTPSLEDPYSAAAAAAAAAAAGGGGQTQLKTELRVPSPSVGAVLGRGGSTINNIRHLSGASIKIKDSEPGSVDRLVEISGTTAQVTTAQQLIQACLVNGK